MPPARACLGVDLVYYSCSNATSSARDINQGCNLSMHAFKRNIYKVGPSKLGVQDRASITIKLSFIMPYVCGCVGCVSGVYRVYSGSRSKNIFILME